MSREASLDALLNDALVSDYQNQISTAPSKTDRILAAIAIIGISFTVVIGISATRQSAAEVASTRTALIERISAAEDRVLALESRMTTANLDLEIAQQAVLDGTSLGQLAEDKLRRLRSAAGYSQVTGDGVEVLLDNGTDIGTNIGLAAVQDQDLQIVVNGLWQAGASAITVNDRRLTTNSAIRSAGLAILVDYRPILAPYRVRAIGDNADAIAGRFRESAAGLMLEELSSNYGVVWELQTLGETTLPSANVDPSLVEESK